MSIFEKLSSYAKSGQYPFHMPGHKAGRLGAFSQISALDITEITGFDNLHKPSGIIKEAQERAAKLFGADESFFLVNGSTCGIEAAIGAMCEPNDIVIMARNCHISVYSALIIWGVRPVYIEPEIEKNSGITGGIAPEKLIALLEKYPKAKAFIITSPTYEGFTSDIGEIRRITNDFDVALLIDEAHGAHFAFNQLFPKSAISYGADIVVQSFHKTLPSLTQTAMLHVNGKKVDRVRLKQTLKMVQTSSPSYLFLASLDSCVSSLNNDGEKLFKAYADRLLCFRESMKGLKNFRIIDKSIAGSFGIFDVDLGKLCFILPKCGISGKQVFNELSKDYGLELEMAGISHVLAMTSISDTDEGFLRLKKAIIALDKRHYENQEQEQIYCPLPHMALSPREAFFASKKNVSIANAAGEVCGEFVIPYPPGIPLLVPGEVISQAAISAVMQMKKCQISITGCMDDDVNEILVLI